MNNKGQIFPMIIIWALVIGIFIFAAPLLFMGIEIGENTGATGFVATLFPWVLFIILLLLGLKILTSGESFI